MDGLGVPEEDYQSPTKEELTKPAPVEGEVA